MPAVEGVVSAGFESLAEVLAASDLGGGGGAFSAYVDGQQVVDLWVGQARPGTVWAKGTLTTLMSTTKGCAALCAMLLHDRGLLDVEAPVAAYWPEFAQAGKERTTVRQLLDHTSGMLCFTDPGDLLDWTGRGWGDYDAIAHRIASSPPAWEPGSRIGYHAISIGWLLQELVRRIDGRTLGAFFADEIAQPLGLDIFIGTPPREQGRVAEVLTGSGDPGDATFVARVSHALRDSTTRVLFDKVLARPGSPLAQAGITMHGKGLADLPAFVSQPQVQALEIPAANGTGNARSLARMFAVLAGGGELEGKRLVSRAALDLFRTASSRGPSALMPRWLPGSLAGPHMSYALGFEGDFAHPPATRRFGPTPESFGHLGAGGQLGFADPVRNVSVGFVRSSMSDWSVSTRLVKELYERL